MEKECKYKTTPLPTLRYAIVGLKDTLMPLGYPQGRSVRANAVASLAGTGHISPGGRRPVGGAVQHAQLPGPAARPGPRALSARQVAALNAQQARARREVEQTLAECKRAVVASNNQMQRRAQSLPFSQYDYDKRKDGRDAVQTEIQIPGTFRTTEATCYKVGELWVYAASETNYGDHTYYLFNPHTGALVEFTPEASRPGSSYASKASTWHTYGSGMGVVGDRLEKGFIGISLIAFTGGAALEVGAYGWAAEEAAPFLARTAVRAWQWGRPMLSRAGSQAWQAAKGYGWKAMGIRVGTDLGIQVTSGAITSHGNLAQRAVQVGNNINLSSLVVSAIINTSGAKLSGIAKFLIAGGTAAAGNLVTVSGDNKEKYKSYVHGVDFAKRDQSLMFGFNVVMGMILDRNKEMLVEKATEKLGERIAQASGSGRARLSQLLEVKKTRVELGWNMAIGTASEWGKKNVEPYYQKLLGIEEKKEPVVNHPTKQKPAGPAKH